MDAIASPFQPRQAPRVHRAPWSARAQHWTVVALLVAILTNQFSVSVGGLTLSLERAAGLMLLPVLGYTLLVGAVTGRARRLVWIWFGWCIVLFVSALATDAPAKHFPALLNSTLPVAILAVFVIAPVNMAKMWRSLTMALWIIATAGTIEIALHSFGHAPLDDIMFVPDDGRMRLLAFEPNILASTLGTLALLALPRSRFNIKSFVLYAMISACLIAAGSKMPMIALAIGISVYFILLSGARQRNLSGAIFKPVWLLGVLVIVALPLSTNIQKVYSSTVGRTDAINGRIYVNNIGLERFSESPIIGRGPGDFAFSDRDTLTRLGTTALRNLWISQMFINIAHDSGVVGLLIYVTFLMAILYRGFAFVRVGSLDHCGSFAAFLSLIISCQATTVHLNAIFGFSAGLLAAMPTTIWNGYSPRPRDRGIRFARREVAQPGRARTA